MSSHKRITVSGSSGADGGDEDPTMPKLPSGDDTRCASPPTTQSSRKQKSRPANEERQLELTPVNERKRIRRDHNIHGAGQSEGNAPYLPTATSIFGIQGFGAQGLRSRGAVAIGGVTHSSPSIGSFPPGWIEETSQAILPSGGRNNNEGTTENGRNSDAEGIRNFGATREARSRETSSSAAPPTETPGDGMFSSLPAYETGATADGDNGEEEYEACTKATSSIGAVIKAGNGSGASGGVGIGAALSALEDDYEDYDDDGDYALTSPHPPPTASVIRGSVPGALADAVAASGALLGDSTSDSPGDAPFEDDGGEEEDDEHDEGTGHEADVEDNSALCGNESMGSMSSAGSASTSVSSMASLVAGHSIDQTSTGERPQHEFATQQHQPLPPAPPPTPIGGLPPLPLLGATEQEQAPTMNPPSSSTSAAFLENQHYFSPGKPPPQQVSSSAGAGGLVGPPSTKRARQFQDMATPLPQRTDPPPPRQVERKAPASSRAVPGDSASRRPGRRPSSEQQRPVKASGTTGDDFSSWAVGPRYELVRMLGRGSYGEVAQARDLEATETRADGRNFVAIKRITSAFEQEVDAIRLFREVHILKRLRGQECIIQLIDIVPPPSENLADFQELYLVFEYGDTDLYKLIMSNQYLTTEHIRTFLYQMLIGLMYIHSFSVIHRDLKPANILVNEDCSLKICDFGLARIVNHEAMSPPRAEARMRKQSGSTQPSRRRESKLPPILGSQSNDSTAARTEPSKDRPPSMPKPMPGLTRQLTKHVVTRWYRAPELILIQPYTSAVDIWSLGCILAELLSMQQESVPGYQDRVPLFPGGSCYPLSGDTDPTEGDERRDQLSVIFGVIGTPDADDIESIGKASEYISTLKKRPPRPLESLYPGADPDALDLLKKMLQFNPRKRVTAEEALEHKFLRGVRRREMERRAEQPLVGPPFLDAKKVEIDTVKRYTYEEVMWYKRQRQHRLESMERGTKKPP